MDSTTPTVVIPSASGAVLLCSCPGWGYRGRCRHAAAVTRELQAEGYTRPVAPEAA